MFGRLKKDWIIHDCAQSNIDWKWYGLAYNRINGKWVIIHDHEKQKSFPKMIRLLNKKIKIQNFWENPNNKKVINGQ